MKIGIDINGVLRDTISKFKTTYEKFLIDNNLENSESENPFDYKIIEPIDSLDLMNHFSFQSKEEFFSFLYEDCPMEIFGHSPSSEMTTFSDLNEIYIKHRNEINFTIISDEISKSKPATLFFLSKFSCQFERIIFYNEITKNEILNDFDLIVTSNPDILINYNKKVIKYKTLYNKKINSSKTIEKIKELDEIIINLKNVKNTGGTLLH
jgi:archaellin